MTLMSDKPVKFLKPYVTKDDRDEEAEMDEAIAAFGPQLEPGNALERLLDRVFGKEGKD